MERETSAPGASSPEAFGNEREIRNRFIRIIETFPEAFDVYRSLIRLCIEEGALPEAEKNAVEKKLREKVEGISDLLKAASEANGPVLADRVVGTATLGLPGKKRSLRVTLGMRGFQSLELL